MRKKPGQRRSSGEEREDAGRVCVGHIFYEASQKSEWELEK